MREIFVINSTAKDTAKKVRTAAYCRVSSSSEEQLASFSSQVREYTTRIEQESSWEMVDIYADEGITGTSMTKRPEFQRLLTDCRRGLIDCIITKSISRFARNVKECLSVLRELKGLEINVIFEKEGINTGDLSGEMLVTVFGAIAQEESTSISGNVSMSYQQRMKKGEFITCKAPYGYRLEKSSLIIHEEESKVIRRIFDMYLNGMSQSDIADTLSSENVYAPNEESRWTRTTIAYILQNEKYRGDALLQKYFTLQKLDGKERRINKGEQTSYYTQNSHPPIVSGDIFNRVQELMVSKGKREKTTIPPSPLSKRIVCKECGSHYMRRQRSKGQVSWICDKHDRNAEDCSSKPVRQCDIEIAFLRCYLVLKHHHCTILPPLHKQLTQLQKNASDQNEELQNIYKNLRAATDQLHVINRLKTKGLIGIEEYQTKSNEIMQQMQSLKRERNGHITADAKSLRMKKTAKLMGILAESPENLTDLDDGEVFSMIVEKVIIDKNKNVSFRLINGLELGGHYNG